MKNSSHYEVIILGSGPAGCTAAVYAARANLKVAVITGNEMGGQLTKTTHIANWPGEPTEISGSVLMEKMIQQMTRFNAASIQDTITQVDLAQHPFVLRGLEQEYSCEALIIATGASPKLLGLKNEQEYIGRGISTCAVCDAPFYKNKEVIVVGGGNTMAEEVIYLSQFASTVTIVHRRETFRTEEFLLTQLKDLKNLQFRLDCVIDEILTDASGVTGARIKNLKTLTTQDLSAHGLFLAIGFTPNSQLFTQQLELEEGFIKTGYLLNSQTSISGVFAAGDIVAQNYRQAIVAAGSGCTAALDAKHFLATTR